MQHHRQRHNNIQQCECANKKNDTMSLYFLCRLDTNIHYAAVTEKIITNITVPIVLNLLHTYIGIH